MKGRFVRTKRSFYGFSFKFVITSLVSLVAGLRSDIDHIEFCDRIIQDVVGDVFHDGNPNLVLRSLMETCTFQIRAIVCAQG